MENKHRNEKLIKIAGEEILLRPTFENLAATENAVGGLPYLSWKLSRGIRHAKEMIGFTDIAKIIYFNQAATKANDVTKKKFSLDEIWEMVQSEGGLNIMPMVMEYIAHVAAGDKMASELSESQKKS